MESASSPMGATFTRGRGWEEVLGVPVQVAVWTGLLSVLVRWMRVMPARVKR